MKEKLNILNNMKTEELTLVKRGDDILFFVKDFAQDALLETPFKMEGEFHFIRVNKKLFLNVLSILDPVNTSFVLQKTSFTIKEGEKKYKIPIISFDDTINTLLLEKVDGEFQNISFSKNVLEVMNTIVMDTFHDEIKGLFFETKEGKLHLRATDGIKFFSETFSCSFPDFKTKLCFPSFLLKNTTPVSILTSDKKVFFKTDGLKVLVNEYVATFPDCNHILNYTNENNIPLNIAKEDFIETLNFVKPFLFDDRAILSITGKKNEILFEVLISHDEYFSYSYPTQDQKEFTAFYRLNEFNIVMKLLEEGFTLFVEKMKGYDMYALILKKDDDFYVLMPMRY